MDNISNVNISNSNMGSNNHIGNISTKNKISINYIQLTKELDNFEDQLKNIFVDDSKNQLNIEIRELKQQAIESKRTGLLDKHQVIHKFKNIHKILSTKIDTSDIIKIFSTIPTWLSYLDIQPQDIVQALS